MKGQYFLTPGTLYAVLLKGQPPRVFVGRYLGLASPKIGADLCFWSFMHRGAVTRQLAQADIAAVEETAFLCNWHLADAQAAYYEFCRQSAQEGAA